MPMVNLRCQFPRSLLECLCTPVGFTRELGPGDVVSLGVAPLQRVGSCVVCTRAAGVDHALAVDAGSLPITVMLPSCQASGSFEQEVLVEVQDYLVPEQHYVLLADLREASGDQGDHVREVPTMR